MTNSFAGPGHDAVYTEDAGTGATVLALPGLGGGAWFFHEFAARLAQGYRVVSLDLPGTGKSASGRGGFSLESWVTDLGALVASRFDAPVVLVGHSLGTIVALEAWKAWPHLIRALVFVGGLPRVRADIHQRLSSRMDVIRREGLSHLGPSVSPGFFSATSLRDRQHVVSLFERQFEAQDAPTYVRACEILLAADATRLTASVEVPCLSVSGEEDQYAPPEAIAEFVRDIPPGCRQEILPGCGHLPFLEAPDAFTAVVKAFLDSLPAPHANRGGLAATPVS